MLVEQTHAIRHEARSSAGSRVWQGMTSCEGLRACAAQVMDMLVEQTHAIRHEVRSNERAMRFTDTRLDEQQRGVSLKMVPLSLVMAGGKGKSYLLNLIDTPGAPLNVCPAPWRSLSAKASTFWAQCACDTPWIGLLSIKLMPGTTWQEETWLTVSWGGGVV